MIDLKNQDGLQMDNGSPPKWTVVRSNGQWKDPKWMVAGPCMDYGSTQMDSSMTQMDCGRTMYGLW
jgi:hypothetical protein